MIKWVKSGFISLHTSIKIVFEIGDPAGTSTVALFLKNKSIININSLRGNIHTEKSRNRKRLDGTCRLITFDFAIAKPITRVWTMSMTQIRFLVCKLVFP